MNFRGLFAATVLGVTSMSVAHANSEELRPFLSLGGQYTMTDELRDSLDGVGGYFGFGIPLMRYFALEGTLSGTGYGAENGGPSWTEYSAEAAGLVTYPVGGGWIPYLTVGLGVAQSGIDGLNNEESDLAASFGGGMFYLLDKWGLRLDARYREIQADGPDLQDGIIRLGGLWMFGEQPPAPAPVKEEVVDPDSDGDGVPDSRDQCPDTPKGVKVDENGCPEVVKVGDDNAGKPMVIVYFDFDKSDIKSSEAAKLDEAIAKLNAMKKGKIVIKLDGHTDSFGTEQYNVGLGERRGQAVRQYLMSHGVDAESISITSYGESKPAADNATGAGRAKNRRVEVMVVEE